MSEIEKLIAWLGDVVSVTPDNRLPVYLSSGEAGQLHVEITRLREENARQAAALRNIAEGNLGDAAWQANYERIRAVARAALPQEPTEPGALAKREPTEAMIRAAVSYAKSAFGPNTSRDVVHEMLARALASEKEGA